MKVTCTKKQFLVYLAIAFVIAYLLEGIACVFASKNNRSVFTLCCSLAMFAPLVATWIANRNLNGLGWKPEFKGKIRFYLMAWFMPSIFAILGGVLFYVIFPQTFDNTGLYLKGTLIAQLGETAGEQTFQTLMEQGMTPMVYALIGLIQVITYAPLMNGVLALGEEVGWRGYMYPYLKQQYGTIFGRIVGGVIWSIWHWPLIIFAGYEYGTEYFGSPFAGPIAFILVTIVFGIFLDYVYEKTECIFVPAIAHGAINATAGITVLFFNPDYTRYSIFGPAIVGVVALVPMLLFTVFISVKEQLASKKA